MEKIERKYSEFFINSLYKVWWYEKRKGEI